MATVEEKRESQYSVRASLAAVSDAVDAVEDYIQPNGATNMSTIMNLMKNLTGSTILVLPIAIHQGGVLGATFLLSLYCVVFGFTFWLLGECCEQTGVTTYKDLWRVSINAKTAWIVDACQGCYGAISSICYVVCIGDYIQGGVAINDPSSFWSQPENKKWIMVGSAIFPLLPLCLLKNLGPLKYTSIMGVFIVQAIFLYTYVLFVEHWNVDPVANDTKINLESAMFKLDWAFFSCIGHAAAAYGVHMNATRFYSELKIRTSENFKKVTFLAFVGSFVLKTPFAIAGYALFGDGINANVLNNFKIWPGITTMALWVAMSVSLICTFPLMFSACRESFFSVLHQLGLKHIFPNKGPVRIAVIIFLLSFVVFIAVAFGKLDNLSRIKGHILANCICLLFPPLIYLKLGSIKEEMPLNMRDKVIVKKQWVLNMSYAMLGASCFMFPLGLYNVFK